MAAVEAGYDLAALSLCVFAIGLLLATRGFVKAIAAPFEVSFPVIGAPFKGIATSIENGVVGWLDDAIKGVEKTAARFFSGMIDALGLLIGIGALLYIGIRAALTYLWNTGLAARILYYTNPINDLALAAKALYGELAGVVSRNLGASKDYAETQATKAISTAETFTTTKIAAAVGAVRGELSAAVSKLEETINTATDGALTTALKAVHAAEVAVEREIEDTASGSAQALAQAQAIGQSALDAVKSIAVTAEDDLATIEGGLGVIGVAGLIAAIPAIATLLQSIATESGLENAECRSKVKGICGTDPSAWANLLEGAALAGVSFGLSDLVAVAKEIISEGEAVMREFA